MSKTALFIQHQRLAPPAMLGDAFAEVGYDNELLLVDETAVNIEFPDPRGFDVIIPLGATLPAYEPALLQTWVGAEMTMLREADRAGVPVLACASAGSYWHRHTAAQSVARIGLKSVGTPSKAMIGGWCPKVLGFSGITTNGRTHPEPPKSRATATRPKPSSCAALSLCSSIRSWTVTF